MRIDKRAASEDPKESRGTFEMVERVENRTRLFGQALGYLEIIDSVLPAAQRHSYRFIPDDSYKAWRDSPDFSLSLDNRIVASELLDKAHLAAVTSLIRTRRWVSALCDAFDDQNYFAWAGATRALMESAGDIWDGLGNTALSIAQNYGVIRTCLAEKAAATKYLFPEIERPLDHFVLAKWMRRTKDDNEMSEVMRSKDNVQYVRHLDPMLPNIESLYHRLCGIVHPSAASLDWTYYHVYSPLLQVRPNDRDAIEAILREWPDAIPKTVMLSCNTTLLILRVLHKFDMHPRLEALRHVTWNQIDGWGQFEAALRS
jgi:hypothetical protein